MFFWLKIIHVISASLLFGVSIGMSFYVLCANLKKNVALIIQATQQFIRMQWCVIAVAGLLQLVTGFAMAFVKGYQLSEAWGVMSIMGYAIAAVCWLPIVFLQMKCRDLAVEAEREGASLPQRYYQYLMTWYALGGVAVASVVMVFYFMVYQSTLP